MKIEKVDFNKIRVTITSDDLQSLNVNMDKLTSNSPELHTFLFQIMERVKVETGFNPYHGQIVVEASPSLDGVILLVTKINDSYRLNKKHIVNVKAVKKQPILKTCIYCFDKFDSLCGILKIAKKDWIMISQLYSMDNKYYITISTKENISKYQLLLSEYSSSFKSSILFKEHLIEHGKLIAKKEKLVEMAAHIKELC